MQKLPVRLLRFYLNKISRMKSFKDVFEGYQWDEIKNKLEKVSQADVRCSLQKRNKTPHDFLNFLSPAASHELELMAKMTQALTQKRFGKRYSCMHHYISAMNVRISVLIVDSV